MEGCEFTKEAASGSSSFFVDKIPSLFSGSVLRPEMRCLKLIGLSPFGVKLRSPGHSFLYGNFSSCLEWKKKGDSQFKMRNLLKMIFFGNLLISKAIKIKSWLQFLIKWWHEGLRQKPLEMPCSICLISWWDWSPSDKSPEKDFCAVQSLHAGKDCDFETEGTLCDMTLNTVKRESKTCFAIRASEEFVLTTGCHIG